MSVIFPPTILGPEMGAPILWAPGNFWHLLQENFSAYINPGFRWGITFCGCFFGGGGCGSAIFFWLRGLCELNKVKSKGRNGRGRGATRNFLHSFALSDRPCWAWKRWAIPPERPERPRKRSQSVSWNSSRECSWDPPSPTIQGIWGYQSISRILSPSTASGDASFFRSGSGEGLSELVMEFLAVLRACLKRSYPNFLRSFVMSSFLFWVGPPSWPFPTPQPLWRLTRQRGNGFTR